MLDTSPQETSRALVSVSRYAAVQEVMAPVIRPRIFVVAAAALLITACGGRGKVEPPTDVVREPEVIGVVTKWEFWDGVSGRYTLNTGDVVDLNIGGLKDRPLAKRLSVTDFSFPNGADVGEPIGRPSTLLLAGHDPDGSAWYAAAPPLGYDGCPYEIRGAGVYDEGPRLHFSTGLVLPKDPGFALELDYHNIEEFPLRSADTICIDEAGQALSARIWLPY